MQAVAQVDAIGEHGEGGGLEDEFLTSFFDVLGPTENSSFQSFCDTPIPRPVEVQYLDEVASFVGEEESRSTEGIDLDDVTGDLGEAVETLAHVAGGERNVDFEVAVESEHGLSRRVI